MWGPLIESAAARVIDCAKLLPQCMPNAALPLTHTSSLPLPCPLALQYLQVRGWEASK